jgi:hypothetical protein
MGKISLAGCVLMVVFLSSCGFYGRKQKQELYDQIVATNDSLHRMTKEWHSILEKAVMMKNFSPLRPQRVQLAQFLSRRRSSIANLDLPPEAETLRGSEQVFLTSQSAMVSDVYPGFELYTDLTPDSTIQNHLRLVEKDMDTELAWNLTIQKSLDAFTQKNRIKKKR